MNRDQVKPSGVEGSYRTVASVRRASAWLYAEGPDVIDSTFEPLSEEVAKILAAGARLALRKLDVGTCIEVAVNGNALQLPVEVVQDCLSSIVFHQSDLAIRVDDPSMNALQQIATMGDVVVDVGCGTGFRILSIARAVGGRCIAIDKSMNAVRAVRQIARASGIQNAVSIWAEIGDLDDQGEPTSEVHWEPTAPHAMDHLPKMVLSLDGLFAQLDPSSGARVIVNIDVPDQLAVVRGASDLLSQLHPIVILATQHVSSTAAAAELDSVGYMCDKNDGVYVCVPPEGGNDHSASVDEGVSGSA